MRVPPRVELDLETCTNSPTHLSWRRQHNILTSSPTISARNVALQTNRVMIEQPRFAGFADNVNVKHAMLPIFDIHFLRKEKLYTKLKYSRCPQYDIVSGGFAALLAGFVGFLISEKFGIELVDSGDFYIAFMYGVFAAFSLRPLILSYSKNDTLYNPLSLKYLLLFSRDLAVLFIQQLRSFFKQFTK
jgi:hypothetical protein